MAQKRLSLAEATIAYRKQEVVLWSKNHEVSEEIGIQINFIDDFVFGEPGQMGRFLLRSSRRLIQVVSYQQNGNQHTVYLGPDGFLLAVQPVSMIGVNEYVPLMVAVDPVDAFGPVFERGGIAGDMINIMIQKWAIIAMQAPKE